MNQKWYQAFDLSSKLKVSQNPSIGEWIVNKMWCIQTIVYYSGNKKKETIDASNLDEYKFKEINTEWKKGQS